MPRKSKYQEFNYLRVGVKDWFYLKIGDEKKSAMRVRKALHMHAVRNNKKFRTKIEEDVNGYSVLSIIRIK